MMRFIPASQLSLLIVSVVFFNLKFFNEDLTAVAQTCPLPVLDRLTNYRIVANDTLEEISKWSRVTPETLMGLNPNLRSGSLPVGESIVIPPINGIRVNVPPGTLIREVAKQYKVRPDVLFEVNGCQPAPSVVFIPGIVWSPRYDTRTIAPSSVLKFVAPFRSVGPVLTRFGLQRSGETHSGVDLAGTSGESVVAVADGTIAFAGVQGEFGNLVVVNHAKGYQTRYGHLAALSVKRGQKVAAGEAIGTLGQTGNPGVKEVHLHFEVRSNSKLGWVAEDPLPWLGL